MLYEIMASLRLHLTEELPEMSKVLIMRDGVSLTNVQKPFLTVENLAEPTTYLSAGRSSVRESYVFQVGVFARDYTEFTILRGKVKEALQQRVPFYDELLALTEVDFVCDVTDFTPIRNDDLANETSNHRGYYDVSVTILRNVGDKVFTQ